MKNSSKIIWGFTKTLKIPKKKSPQPIAIAPFGPCRVGKTTTMTYLTEKLPFVRISHDDLRLFIRKRKYTDDKINDILYKQIPIIKLSKYYLNKGYSVILDRDFGTKNKHILKITQKEMKKLRVNLFLIRIWAPRKFIYEKIMTRKLIPLSKGGIPDRKTAMDCYLYSVNHYTKNYRKLIPKAIAAINTSKSIPHQIGKITPFLKKEMGL